MSAKEAVSRGQEAPKRDLIKDVLGLSGKKAADVVPDEEIELRVEDDPKRLVLLAVLFFVLTLVSVAAALACISIANVTGSVWLLLGFIVCLTATWFLSRRTGFYLRRRVRNMDVAAFGKKHLLVYEGSDPTQAKVIAYKDIKKYELVRQGSATRLLLWGSWVEHPSGVYYVGINRPFGRESLDGMEADVRACMKRHHVNERI